MCTSIKHRYSVFGLCASFDATRADLAIVELCHARYRMALPVFDNAFIAPIHCFGMVSHINTGLITTGLELRCRYLCEWVRC